MNKPAKLCVIVAVLLLAVVCFAGTAAAGDPTPNDPRFSEQWALQNMNVPEAWTYTTGSDKVVVAVIDSGVNYNHLDIIDNMWTNPGEIPDNGIDDDGNGYVDDYYGFDFINNTSNPMDVLRHGTHVAGIIGAVGNNGIGISGVCQEVSIMALQVVDSDEDDDMDAFVDAVVDAIRYATAMGADVINLSLGTYYSYMSYEEVLREAVENGVFVVAGVGNNIEDTDVSKFYPASDEIPGLISVAALDSTDALAVYSNYGSFTADVAAPGGGIPYDLLSLSYSDNDGYVMLSGTSMATPMVSGLAALLLAENPELTPADLKCIIMATVTPDPELEGKVVSGGRVNAGEALKNAVHNKYHMVTFNSLVKKEGSETMTEIGSQVVEDGACIREPENPEKYFMQFDGWYTESGTKWDFSTPVTGEVNLYAKWVEDTSLPVDTSWYTPEQTEYHISTASQLLGLSKIVYDAEFDNEDPASYAFYGKTVTLDNDISLAGINWVPVGVGRNNAFAGVFNGNGHTISGLSIDLPKENYVGLFGCCTGRITGLTLKASTITGHNYVGTLCGEGNLMDNVHITVDTVDGRNSVGGILGYRPSSADTADDSAITAIITGGIYAVAATPDDDNGSPAKGAGGAIGWGAGNNIAVVAGDIICKNPENEGMYVGGAFGYAPAGFHNVSVNLSSISGLNAVGGIAGYATGDISNCSAVVRSLDAESGGGAVGGYYPMDVSRTENGDGNTIKDIFVLVNGNAAGGAIGFVRCTDQSMNYNLTIENVLVTGTLLRENPCGGIVGCIGDNTRDAASSVILKNCVSLPEKIGISAEDDNKCGRIYGSLNDENTSVDVNNSYAWEETVNSSGELFEPSDKNGENVATSDVWNNQSFFENLGWNFNGVWKMNAGNSNYKLPVLQNTLGTGNLDASYLVHRTAGFSLPSLFEMKTGTYMLDSGKDAAAKAAETKPAKSPFPVLGILAGLGIAGILVMRRH